MTVAFAQTPDEEDRVSYVIWQKRVLGTGDSSAKVPKLGCTCVYQDSKGITVTGRGRAKEEEEAER